MYGYNWLNKQFLYRRTAFAILLYRPNVGYIKSEKLLWGCEPHSHNDTKSYLSFINI
jgi:hypothetical protein